MPGREVREDPVADLRLPAGQLEGQPLIEAVQDPSVPAGPRRGLEPLQPCPPLGEHHLGDERLVEAQSLLGGGLLRPGPGTVDPLQRRTGADQVVLGADRLGQRVRDLLDQVEGQRDRVLQRPRLHGGGGRVERDQVGHAVPGRHRLLVPALHRVGGEDPGLRVGQLPGVAEPADLAGEQSGAALDDGAAPPLRRSLPLVEEGQHQPGVLGLDDHLQAVGEPAASAIGVLHLLAGQHPTDHGDVLALGDRAPAEPPLLDVAARVVLQQVPDRAEAEGLLDLARRASGDGGDLGVPGDGRHVVPLRLLDADQERVSLLAALVDHDVDGRVPNGQVLSAARREIGAVPAGHQRDQLATAAEEAFQHLDGDLEQLAADQHEVALDHAEGVARLARSARGDRASRGDGDRPAAGVPGRRGHLQHVVDEAAAGLVDGERGQALDLGVGGHDRHHHPLVLACGTGGGFGRRDGGGVVGQQHHLGGPGRGDRREKLGGPRPLSGRDRYHGGAGTTEQLLQSGAGRGRDHAPAPTRPGGALP